METTFTRLCPSCGSELHYKSAASLYNSTKGNKPCRSCSATEKANRPHVKAAFVARLANTEVCSGKNNKFFGKKHSEATKQLLREAQPARRAIYQTPEFLSKMSAISAGSNNPMYGKTVYDIWVSKYGPEEADRKMTALKQKHSANNSGAKNPMYGKPSPTGSGNGWSGWYKGWYFRSLKELSFMINVIEAQGLTWHTGETLHIPYTDAKGAARTYSPDFVISDTRLVEIKPTKLKSSQLVRLKQAAAEHYCVARGWTYESIDPPPLDDAVIKQLREQNHVRFIDRYETLFRQIYDHKS